MIKKLSKYMKGLWGLALISASGMIIEAICELAMPSLANTVYELVNDTQTPDDAKATVIKIGVFMFLLAIIGDRKSVV